MGCHCICMACMVKDFLQGVAVNIKYGPAWLLDTVEYILGLTVRGLLQGKS